MISPRSTAALVVLALAAAGLTGQACGGTDGGESAFGQPPGSLFDDDDDGGDGFGDGGTRDPSGEGGGLLGDVEAVVTTDNAFSFGYGNADGLTTFIQGTASDGPEIFDCPVDYGPEPFTVPAKDAPSGAFLYIVAWADRNVTQGTLAQFKRTGGSPIYSGDGNWQVCATGEEFDGFGMGPNQARVDQAIVDCNAGSAGPTYSKGWVNTSGAVTTGAIGKLAYGETNEDPGGDFPVVCPIDDRGVRGIDPQARWMWFDPQDGVSPFQGNAGNRTKTFLVFRLPAAALDGPR